MRHWTLIFSVLAVMALVLMPVMASEAQAQTTKIDIAASIDQQPVGVAVQVGWRGYAVGHGYIRGHGYYFQPYAYRHRHGTVVQPRIQLLPRYQIIRPYMNVPAKETWTARRYGVRPFHRLWVYRQLE